MISWDAIDTVLLDMDGTLLDLAYDNTLWTELLPQRYSEHHALTVEESASYLFAHMGETRGRLEFYCLEYWAEFTGLDIDALHLELTHLIAYRPFAEDFLTHIKRLGRRSVLVTNAHRGSLAVKEKAARLCERLDAVVSCHDYGAPKESEDFWLALMAEHPFEPSRTLLIDDNADVLHSAERFGIGHVLTIAQPDSGQPERADLAHRAVTDFRELMTEEAGR
ncbi:MAG: GMP/IMP nucleotidase [Pseudomonadota bacterium]